MKAAEDVARGRQTKMRNQFTNSAEGKILPKFHYLLCTLILRVFAIVLHSSYQMLSNQSVSRRGLPHPAFPVQPDGHQPRLAPGPRARQYQAPPLTLRLQSALHHRAQRDQAARYLANGQATGCLG